MTEIFKPPFLQASSISGAPLAGAKLYFYQSGTTTPITVYQDYGKTTPHANPVVADSAGIFPAIYVDTSVYKTVLKTSADVTVKTDDPIYISAAAADLSDEVDAIEAVLEWTFDSVEDAEDATMPASVKAVRTRFYAPDFATAAGLVGGARYRRVTSQPSHELKFRSVDRFLPNGTSDNTNGGWWAINEPILNVHMAGATGAGSVDEGPAFQRTVNYVLSLATGGAIYVPTGRYAIETPVVFTKTSGKAVYIYGDGSGSVIDCGDVTDDDAAFYVGSGTAAGGTGFRANNLKFIGASATVGTAFELENANGAEFDNIFFSTMLTGVSMISSFAVSFRGCQSLDVGSITIYSSTACHNLIIDRFKVFNAGIANTGRFLQIDVATDNIVIVNSEFEICRQVLTIVGGGTALLVQGNYIEYCTTDAFAFGAAVYGASITDNWLSYGTAFNLNYLIGGEFKRNTMHDQNIAFGATSRDVETGYNRLTGTSAFTACPPTLIASFSNGSTAGTQAPGYFLGGDDYVRLTGKVNIGVNGDVVFNLPAGYRPGADLVLSAVNPTGTAPVQVVIGANGNVVPNASSGSLVSLDGLFFKRDV